MYICIYIYSIYIRTYMFKHIIYLYIYIFIYIYMYIYKISGFSLSPLQLSVLGEGGWGQVFTGIYI
jgi:hypothetical protein